MPDPGAWLPARSRRYGTVWQLVTPDQCPNGHALKYPNVTLSWTGCGCAEVGGGHHLAHCLTDGCGATVVFPPCTDETQRAR